MPRFSWALDLSTHVLELTRLFVCRSEHWIDIYTESWYLHICHNINSQLTYHSAYIDMYILCAAYLPWIIESKVRNIFIHLNIATVVHKETVSILIYLRIGFPGNLNWPLLMKPMLYKYVAFHTTFHTVTSYYYVTNITYITLWKVKIFTWKRLVTR